MMLSQSNMNTIEPVYYANVKKYASSNSEGTLYQNKAETSKNKKNKIDLSNAQKEMDLNLFTESPQTNKISNSNKI